jgi:ferric-dicitrate binding protein FerR (iron transport regulator)
VKLKRRIDRGQDKHIQLSDIALAKNHGSGVYFYTVAASVAQMMDTSLNIISTWLATFLQFSLYYFVPFEV